MQEVEMSKNLILPIYPPVYQTACLPASLSISVFLTICMSVYLHGWSLVYEMLKKGGNHIIYVW